MNPWLDLTKPRLTLTSVFTGLCGFSIAAEGGLWPRFGLLATGLALVGGGANVLNQYYERDSDALMDRTRRRPIPAGRLLPEDSARFGLALVAAGLAILYGSTNLLTTWLGALACAIYLWVYTPLKKITPWNTLVGAVVGALPVLMGWTAGSGRLTGAGWALFAFLYVWQLPPFLAIAWIYRDDYRKGGLRMPPGGLEAERTGRLILAAAALTFAASILPFSAGAAGYTYFFMSIFFGTLFTGYACALWAARLEFAGSFVGSSILYLILMNASLLWEKI